MGIWVRTYAVLHVQVGVNVWKNGEWSRLYDVAVSWLRLQTPKDCIPHLLWMGIWVHPYAFNTLCREGWILGNNGEWPSLYDVAVSC
jgi:hypothetical protein